MSYFLSDAELEASDTVTLNIKFGKVSKLEVKEPELLHELTQRCVHFIRGAELTCVGSYSEGMSTSINLVNGAELTLPTEIEILGVDKLVHLLFYPNLRSWNHTKVLSLLSGKICVCTKFYISARIH